MIKTWAARVAGRMYSFLLDRKQHKNNFLFFGLMMGLYSSHIEISFFVFKVKRVSI